MSADQSETRPATTTVFGDTGLWFVPTGEVLPKGRWSASGYRVNWDRTEAFTDVSDFRVTFGYGLSDRVELFGNADLQRRIDADRRPVRAGGTSMDDPQVFQQWGTGFGDIRVGVKANITAPWREQAAAFAIRAGVKIAFGTDSGVSKHGINAQEFQLMVDAGMTPIAAIQAATVNAADLLGRSATLGTIEKDKDADIIAVAGSPLDDVKRLENIGFVMRRGVVHKLGGQRQVFPSP